MEEQSRRWGASMSDAYDRLMVPVTFEPFATELLPRVAAAAPKRVLEVAAGTGVVTRMLVDLPGVESVIATDLNPAMVDAGGRNAPGARWETADAMDLPFDAAEFDAVVCQFGVMFFPDKVAGMAEARRVLTPDGTYLVSTWGSLEEHEFEAAYMAAVRTVIPDDPPDFLAKVPHGYADPDQLADDARAAGFTRVAVERVALRTKPVRARDAVVGYCTGSPMRPGLEARGDLQSLTEAIAATTERHLGTEPITFGMAAYVLTAGG